MGVRWRRLTVGVVWAVLQGVGEVNVVLRQVRLMHAEALRDLRHRGHVNRLLAARGGLSCPHVPVVDMCLQVTLGEVGALAPWHDTAHVEGAALALLNALDRVGAVIQGEAEKT